MYYTSHPGAVNPENPRVKFVKENHIGLMISAASWQTPFTRYALDNGAWTDHLYGHDFDSDRFLKTVEKTDTQDIKPDFIILPDRFDGGNASLELSKKYLYLADNYPCYLAVQPGMTPDMVDSAIGGRHNVCGIFVGGSHVWKYRYLHTWVSYAHSAGLKLHVGKVGTLADFQRCAGTGADSADGSALVRHNKLHKICEYLRIVNSEQRRFTDEY